MASPVTDFDEPLTPAGRLFVRPEMNQIIHCALGVKNQLDIDAVKSQIRDSFLLKHPRFCSLMVVDHHGLERWRRTSVELDRHLIIIESPVNSNGDDEAAVNEYLADMSTESGLSLDKPLWEIHFLMAHKCVVFRIHHALGDGISLMSMLLSGCRKVGEPDAVPSLGPVSSTNRRKTRVGKSRYNYYWDMIVELVGVLWHSLVFVMEFLVKLLWLCDRKTAISGGDGVELWPRKLATARFFLDDMKIVKKAIDNAVSPLFSRFCAYNVIFIYFQVLLLFFFFFKIKVFSGSLKQCVLLPLYFLSKKTVIFFFSFSYFVQYIDYLLWGAKPKSKSLL